MKLFAKILTKIGMAAALCAVISSCNNDTSYAELLTSENHYVNAFLADQRVVNSVPADTVFEVGPDAPYYRIDEDGHIYMQVVEYGTKGNDAEQNERICFSFWRYYVSTYTGYDPKTHVYSFTDVGDGNSHEVLAGTYEFRYQNFSLASSYNHGPGIQAPLNFLPVDCCVNLIIKSQKERPSTMSNVTPFFYEKVRYYRPKV